MHFSGHFVLAHFIFNFYYLRRNASLWNKILQKDFSNSLLNPFYRLLPPIWSCGGNPKPAYCCPYVNCSESFYFNQPVEDNAFSCIFWPKKVNQMTVLSQVRHEANSVRALELDIPPQGATPIIYDWVTMNGLLYPSTPWFPYLWKWRVNRACLSRLWENSVRKQAWHCDHSLCVSCYDYCWWWCYCSHLRPMGTNLFCQ